MNERFIRTEMMLGSAAMDKLHALTDVDVPEPLAKLRDMPVRFDDCVDKDQMLNYVKNTVQ